MTWDEVKERIVKEDKEGTVTWEEVKKQVKKEKEDQEKKWQEIRKYDAETSERLDKKSTFVTGHSIKFTRDEYDKLKTAFCKGKGWSLDYPHTVSVRSITLTGNYKSMPASDLEFRIEVEGTKKLDCEKEGHTWILKEGNDSLYCGICNKVVEEDESLPSCHSPTDHG